MQTSEDNMLLCLEEKKGNQQQATAAPRPSSEIKHDELSNDAITTGLTAGGVAELSKSSTTTTTTTTTSNSRNTAPFPWKLYFMLETAEEEGFSDIISWTSTGRGFKIHNPIKFVATILPRFISDIKWRSFLRQLNLYNFKRINEGIHRGVYDHESLIRGQPHLCRSITRTNSSNVMTSSTNMMSIASSSSSPKDHDEEDFGLQRQQEEETRRMSFDFRRYRLLVGTSCASNSPATSQHNEKSTSNCTIASAPPAPDIMMRNSDHKNDVPAPLNITVFRNYVTRPISLPYTIPKQLEPRSLEDMRLVTTNNNNNWSIYNLFPSDIADDFISLCNNNNFMLRSTDTKEGV